MDTSLAHENARLRALLQTQQDTIRQMAEYNRLLSQRVAAYASEINRLKTLVAKLDIAVPGHMADIEVTGIEVRIR
ncbi:IS66 family transposase [Escherichia coli]|nr:hypothetical protein WKI_03708 [Escherichia coli KTE166]OTE25398.1 IS66 family transposase [Escherichia coli]PBQ55540.1 hypothetical protein COD51_22985 [Escherichia coli]